MANSNPGKSSEAPKQPIFDDPLLNFSFQDPKEKQDKEVGRKLASRIYKEQNNNQSSTIFWAGRNVRWKEVWEWAMGRQNMTEFLDLMKIDGNNAYTGIDTTPNRQGPQFVETLVNSMAQNDIYPRVTAIDDGSTSEKEKRKMDALFRMHEAGRVNSAQQASGLHLEPPDAYVPDDELSAEVHFRLEDRLPKEMRFEELLEKTLVDNQWKNVLSRRLLRDLVVQNCTVTKIEREANGYISIRKCIGPNMIYNFFMADSGKMDVSYIGEIYNLKIKDLRNKWGEKLTEKDLFEISKTATQYNYANRFNYYWNDSYIYSIDRPYDDWSIQVFDFEIQTFDADYYVSKTDSFGKENIQSKNGIPQPKSDKAKVIKKDKLTWYRGVWAVKSDKMIYWGLPDVVIKPYMDIAMSLSSYTINIPNNDGDYVPSLFERALEPLREYTLCKLKRKQLIANLRASGVMIDVETARDVDNGNGNVLGWEEVIKIYNQTGNVVWSSKGLNPLQENRPPIVEMPNAGSIAQLNELSNIIDRCMAEIRGVLGVPQYRDGSDLPPRMGQGVVENQIANSNNVTDYVLAAFHQVIQETLHKCCILKWDEIVLQKDETGLMDTIFEVNVEIKPTAEEKQLTESEITVGMQEGLLTFKDALYIRSIKNFKLQQLYISSIIEKNKKDAQAAQTKNVQDTAQAQQASNQQTAQNNLSIKEQEHKWRLEEIEAQQRGAERNAMSTGLWAVLSKTGGEVPPMLQPLATQMFQNVSMGVVLENAMTKLALHNAVEAATAQQQQDQQQAIAQQQQSQQPQPQAPGQPPSDPSQQPQQ